jgi:hypothetical protein
MKNDEIDLEHREQQLDFVVVQIDLHRYPSVRLRGWVISVLAVERRANAAGGDQVR